MSTKIINIFPELSKIITLDLYFKYVIMYLNCYLIKDYLYLFELLCTSATGV